MTTSDPQRFRYLWLCLGAAMSLFAVGGRWDIALLAWLYPVFLLRFGRASRLVVGMACVWLVMVGGALFWMFELAVPVQLSTVMGSVAFGTVFTVPYLLDRLFAARLSVAGGLLLFPAARAAAEFLMGVYSPLGTAYGLLAVTQHENLALLQVISVTGPYAIGFLIGWFGTTVNFVWERRDSPAVRVVVGAFATVLLSIYLAGAARLAFAPPVAEYVRIAGIAVDPAASVSNAEATNEALLNQTRQAAHAGAQIVAWSENAAVLAADAVDSFVAKAAVIAREENIHLLVASNVPRERDETHLIDPNGDVRWTYRKARPIPGLETYVPGGAATPVVETAHGRIANVICYDADFPALMRASADIMLVPGGDWPQMGRVHTLMMARLRSIEGGYALVRVDVNGLSAAFDHQGRVIAAQDTTTPGFHIMSADVPTRGAATLYRAIGDIFAWLCVGVVIVLVATAVMRRREHAV